MAQHVRSWAKHTVITDPAHVTTAAALRQHFTQERRRRVTTRHHHDGHPVALRALPDYDAMFGVTDFTSSTTQFDIDTSAMRTENSAQ